MPLSPQILSEYEALTHSTGVVDVSDRTKIELRGSDRAKFLHNFCSNDIKRLQPGDSCEAFVCNVKGHILAHIHVLCRDDALWLDTVAGQAEKLVAHLDRYLIREDVQIADRTADFDAYCTFGSDSRSFRWDIAPQARLLWLPRGEQIEGVRCGREALDMVRLEQGYPWYGVDISEENLPQEVGRDAQAISFTKGCYLGQETVARIDALGHVNKQLCGVAFAGEAVPAAGQELSAEGKVVGQVTSACWSPRLSRPLALAYMRRGYHAPEARLECSSGKADVLRLPLELVENDGPDRVQ